MSDETVEMRLGGQWEAVTVRETEAVEMSRGRDDEAGEASPAETTLTLGNRDGTYSRHNPLSPWYGLLGPNTPVRVRDGDLPADETPVVTDTFARTSSSGWGTADTGQTWATYDLMGTSPPATDYTVASGTGRLNQPSADTAGIRAIRTSGVSLADLDATFTVTTDAAARSVDGGTAVFGGFFARLDPVADSFYAFGVRLAADTGSSLGLRVGTDIAMWVGGTQADITQSQTVPGLSYESGTALRVRIRVDGAELRMRVWADGQDEPDMWHSQAYDTQVAAAGEVGFLAQTTAEATAMPYLLHVGDLTVRPAPAADDGTVRATAEVAEQPPRWELSDQDGTVPLVASGILRRLEQGTRPRYSPLRRHIPDIRPLAYWPMEEGTRGDRQAAAAVGDRPLSTAGLSYGQVEGPAGSKALPQIGEDTSYWRSGTLPSPTGTALGWQVSMLIKLPSTDDWPATESRLLRWTTTGTAAEWIITAETVSSEHVLRCRVLDPEGSELGNETAGHESHTAAGGLGVADQWRVLIATAEDTGSTVDWRFAWWALDGASTWGNGDAYTGSLGRVLRIGTTTGGGLGGSGIGHLSVWGITHPPAYYDTEAGVHAAEGWDGETARQRARRIAAEDSIPVTVTGPAATPMGPQPTDTAGLDILQECADADLGILHEQRATLGLVLRARASLYNQTPALTLDYGAGEVSDPVEPADDDQRIRNQVTASRTDGSSYEAERAGGPLGVDTIGLYADDVTVNVQTDAQLAPLAWWLLHQGTTDALRLPSITVNLANPRLSHLAVDALRVAEGDLIRINNPPSKWTGPGPLLLLVEGCTETRAEGEHTLTWTCSPGGVWTVGEVPAALGDAADGPTAVGSSGSQLASAVSETATALAVAVTSGPLWRTGSGAGFDFDVAVGGEHMTVTQITGTSSPQTFTVTRSANGITKSHDAGAAVDVATDFVVPL